MDYSVKTHKGKRKNNQDFAGVFINQSNLLLALLADGLGGHRAGDIASEMAVSQLGHLWEQTSFTGEDSSTVQKWLDDKINGENKRIYELSNKYPDLEGMGTTLVASVVLDDEILLSNIGDSRAYTYKEEQLEQITEDHSFVSELQRKGELTDEEARNHYNRNALTRSLGVKGRVLVDFFRVKKSSLMTIMLNSDGLTNVLGKEEIIQILADEKTTLDSKSQTLVQLAVDNEGSDNITVLLINFKNRNALDDLTQNKVGEE